MGELTLQLPDWASRPFGSASQTPGSVPFQTGVDSVKTRAVRCSLPSTLSLVLTWICMTDWLSRTEAPRDDAERDRSHNVSARINVEKLSISPQLYEP